jgi:phosphoribosyl-ATP pyrophosphohydrolase
MSLETLAATIAARKGSDPESSWTARLLAMGPEKCAAKFGEEAVEAIIEAVKGDRDRLCAEAADVLYHLLVMLAARDARGRAGRTGSAAGKLRHRRKGQPPLGSGA